MSKKIDHNIELMAPAGSFESLRTAIKAGADSVFFGVTQLNMRTCSIKSKGNFGLEDLEEVMTVCKEAGIKGYLTVNTIIYDHDLHLMKRIVDEAKRTGVDAVIVADFASLEYAKSIGMNLHVSTQFSVSNYEAVKFFANYSDTVVLARELTLPMVKNITERIKKDDLRGPSGKPVKIEVFGHGAICVAVSGRCSMSLLTDNSSANRGACKQPCRRSYTVIDEDTGKALSVENNFVFSPSDLCTVGKLDEFVDAGIAILKVEGRGRSPEYVDTVISTYKEALQSLRDGTYTQEKIEKWNKDLGTVYNRGFSEGFYMGKPWIEWSGVYGNKATTQKEYVGEVLHYYPKPSIAEVWVQSGEFAETDKYSITGPTTGLVKGEGVEIWMDENKVEKAEKGQTITFKVSERVRKGDKLYKIVSTE